LGGRALHLAASSSLPLRPNKAIDSPGGSGNPSGTPINIRNLPELFRRPNTIFQYINLYLSDIPRLLVMSVISFGTLNYLRYIKTHKLIIPIVIER
jgi:hypothetical protein